MTETEILQRILDDQGYIVVGWHKPAVKGQVFDLLDFIDTRLSIKVAVVGEAEGSELVAQERKYYPHDRALGISSHKYHFKVAAE